MLIALISMMGIVGEMRADGVLPEYTTDMENPVYYRIKNLYQSKYAVYNGTGDNMGLTTKKTEASLFYFVKNGDDVNVPGLESVTAPSVLIYSENSGTNALKSANSWAENAGGRHWFLYEKTNESYHGFVMCYAETTNALKVGSTDTQIVYYNKGATGYDYKGSVFAVEKVGEEPEEIYERIPIPDGSANGDELTKEVLEQDVDGNTLSAKYTITNGTWGNNASHLSIFKTKIDAATASKYERIVVKFAEIIPTSTGSSTYGFIPVGLVSPLNWQKMGGLDEWEYTFTADDKSKGIDDFSIFFNANGDLKDIEFTITGIYLVRKDTPIDPVDPDEPSYDKTDADVNTFSKDKFNDNKWEFETPVDLSEYKYMIVTTVQSAGGNLNGFMILTDNTGKRAGNNWDSSLEINYDAAEAGTRGSMWLDRWNNQHCACINLDYLRKKGLDTKNIVKFEVPHGENISAVYLTNYTDGKAVSSTESWGSCSGDYVRENALLEDGKFGTIALKYGAAVSGAKLYTVDEFDTETGIMVLAEVENGIAEAGVPYIYVACDFKGHGADGDAKGSNSNVNFYRIDSNAISGDWSDNKARDNGLVGYYDGGFWPGAGALNNCYIISGNQLHKITGGDITLGANRCFFDPAKYQGPKDSAGVKAYLGAFAEDETAIKDIQNKSLTEDKIYDINGRQVTAMKKGGIYIMNGIKVVIK